jgi:hypothetical protein
MTARHVHLLAVAAGLCATAAPSAVHAQDCEPATSAPPVAPPPHTHGTCAGCPPKRPLRAALEGLAVNLTLNRFDAWVRNAYNPREGHWARVGPRTWSANLRDGWEWDTDEFSTNMFMHPVHGAVYFRAGRENGLNFWESIPLSFLGSAEWEYFGETARPSLNDFYNTSFGGIALGEMTYRLAALVRDNRGRGVGRIFRELAAVPLDPIGSLRRLLNGDFTRVSADPVVRGPGALALQLQGGVRLAVDSGPARRRSAASALIAQLDYGDAFTRSYAQPFDVFTARLLIGAGASPVNELRVAGRLFGHEFTNRSTTIRTFFTVLQKIEYTGNPAYKFGGQSLDVGLVAGFALPRWFDVRLEGYAEGIMLGAVDAPGAGVQGSPRTYDFGPGVGFELAASLQQRTFPLLTARWHWTLVHSVSGSPADHFTQLPSIEAGVPLGRRFGLGAYAGWYRRRSIYTGSPGEVATYPDYRAYLMWQTHERPAAGEDTLAMDRGAPPFPALTQARAVAPATARVPRRGGLWVDAGAGYGRLRLTCATCARVAAAGGTEVTVTIGGAPSANVLLGLQAQTWSRAGPGPTQRVRSLAAVAQWYPWPAAGWFVRAGTGIVQGPVTPRTDSTPPTTVQGTGVGLDLGVGFDFPVSEHFGLTVQAATHIAALGDLLVGGQAANDVIAYVTRLGIAVVMR